MKNSPFYKEPIQIRLLLGRRGRPCPKSHVFTYTGLIKCGVCGSSITACEKTKALISTGETKTYTFYQCTRRKKGAENCTERKFIPATKIEEMIINELSLYEIKPIFKESALEILKQNHAPEIEKRQYLVNLTLKEEAKLKR